MHETTWLLVDAPPKPSWKESIQSSVFVAAISNNIKMKCSIISGTFHDDNNNNDGDIEVHLSAVPVEEEEGSAVQNDDGGGGGEKAHRRHHRQETELTAEECSSNDSQEEERDEEALSHTNRPLTRVEVCNLAFTFLAWSCTIANITLGR